MMGSIGFNTVIQTGNTNAFQATSATESVSDALANQVTSSTQTEGKQTISTLARQLAASAVRADERDKTLSRSALASKAKTAMSQISGDSYQANKKNHDSEVPNTSDPALLDRAKQSTAYVNDAAKGGHAVKNPFAGLSREQLSHIIYDESGTYTVNERRAASYEADIQEEAWRVKVMAQSTDEYNNTGKLTNFFQSVLDHFKELPAIEQAQYPIDYASDLQSKIDLDFNYRTHQAEGKGPMSLFETLFPQNTQQAKPFFPEPKNMTDPPTNQKE